MALQCRAGDLDCGPAHEKMAAVFKLPVPALRLTACLLLLGWLAPAFAQSFSTLEERMSVTQFRAAGLDKLSPEELAALNAWLQQNIDLSQAAPVAHATDRRLLDAGKGTIRSRIPGQFQGWSGKTTFQLENGQVWQQVGNDPWYGAKLEDPVAIIEPSFMGSYRLKIEGYNATTKVKRIK